MGDIEYKGVGTIIYSGNGIFNLITSVEPTYGDILEDYVAFIKKSGANVMVIVIGRGPEDNNPKPYGFRGSKEELIKFFTFMHFPQWWIEHIGELMDNRRAKEENN